MASNLDPYKIIIGGVKADPYRIDRAYGEFPAPIFQALKKILRCGRKHKDQRTDVEEAISSLQRWLEMENEDHEQHNTNK